MNFRGQGPGTDVVAIDTPRAIRDALIEREAYGRYSSVTDAQFERLYAHIGHNFELTLEVLQMRPWPSWLSGVLFPGRTSQP